MTPNERTNIYVNASGGDKNGFRAGLGCLLDECQRLRASRVWIVCSQKTNFTGGFIEAALGTDIAKLLGKGEPVSVNGLLVVPHCVTTLPRSGDGSPVITAYLNARGLKAVDELHGVPSLIVVSWGVDIPSDVDTKAWREKWQPLIIDPA